MSGRVVVDGLELTAMKSRELPRVRRHLVGFVFQTFNLLESLTPAENVEVALNVAGITGAEARTRARALLVDSGLEERLDFGARYLSAGEKQRVALARALANSPKLLLADEPTANLDARSGREVMELLADLTRTTGAAALVVSHDDRLRTVADRVLVLEEDPYGGADRAAGTEEPDCEVKVDVGPPAQYERVERRVPGPRELLETPVPNRIALGDFLCELGRRHGGILDGRAIRDNATGY